MSVTSVNPTSSSRYVTFDKTQSASKFQVQETKSDNRQPVLLDEGVFGTAFVGEIYGAYGSQVQGGQGGRGNQSGRGGQSRETGEGEAGRGSSGFLQIQGPEGCGQGEEQASERKEKEIEVETKGYKKRGC